MVHSFADASEPEDARHRSIGLFNFKQSVYRWRFGGGVEVNVVDHEGRQVVEYRTPQPTSARTATPRIRAPPSSWPGADGSGVASRRPDPVSPPARALRWTALGEQLPHPAAGAS